MSKAEVTVVIRYGQIVFSMILLLVLAYLGLTWVAHKIGFCVVVPCAGLFYYISHAPGAFVLGLFMFLALLFPVSALHDRWAKDVEREEARLQEEHKRKVLK